MDDENERDAALNIQRFEEVNLDDEITVLARSGRGQSIIGRLTDGRVILFPKEHKLNVKPGDTVIGKVVHISKTYVIVSPEKVMGDTMEALLENLKNVSMSGYYQHAVLAKGMLFLITKELGRKGSC